jgi:hypothetical protein
VINLLKSSVFFFALLLALGFMVNPGQTQSAFPLPARDSIELLTNGDFETDLNTDKIPGGWTGKNTSLTKSDKLKCNKPDDVIAHSGECAFMFRGNPGGIASKLMQTISDVSALTDGSTVQFSAYIDPRSGTLGAIFGKAKISLSDDSKITLKLVIPAGNDYSQVVDSAVLNLAGETITQVKIQFITKQTQGKFLIDATSLIVISPELPTVTPENTDIPNTPTTTPTDDATQTPPLTETPTATPFAFDCNQLIATWSNDAFHENRIFVYLMNKSDKDAELLRVQVAWQDLTMPFDGMYLGAMSMYDDVHWSGGLPDNDNSVPGQTSVDTGILTEGFRDLTAQNDVLWEAVFFDGPAELGEHMVVEDFSAYFTFDIPGAFEDCVIELQNLYPDGTPTSTPIPHLN